MDIKSFISLECFDLDMRKLKLNKIASIVVIIPAVIANSIVFSEA